MDKKLPKFVGTINIPGDKSISHRALIIGSQATGIVKVTNLLESADVFSTMNALRKFGVHIVKRGKDYYVYGLTLFIFLVSDILITVILSRICHPCHS